MPKNCVNSLFFHSQLDFFLTWQTKSHFLFKGIFIKRKPHYIFSVDQCWQTNYPLTNRLLKTILHQQYIAQILTRPKTPNATEAVNQYISWGAGPRAYQYLVVGAKCHAAIHGKYSPDLEDVKAVAHTVLKHRIVLNYKAEAEGIAEKDIIDGLL